MLTQVDAICLVFTPLYVPPFYKKLSSSKATKTPTSQFPQSSQLSSRYQTSEATIRFVFFVPVIEIISQKCKTLTKNKIWKPTRAYISYKLSYPLTRL